jgi:hypothetical protein
MKTSLRKILTVACAALVTSALAVSAHAQAIAAYTISPTLSNPETDQGNYGPSGFEFTLNQNINITALGYTAISLDDTDAPSVTLWSVGAGGALSQIYTTGNILGSVNITNEGTQPSAPSFVSVGTPIALTSGNTYLVTATAYWAATFDPSTITTNSAFTGTFFTNSNPQNSFVADGSWDYNLTNISNLVALSDLSPGQIPTEANFEFTPGTSVVPEPATYVMLGAGLVLLLVIQRKRASRLL